MTARHSTLFTLESGNSGLGFYTTQRDAANAVPMALAVALCFGGSALEHRD
jgi:hypothetical protein